MNWAEFEKAAPELAALGRTLIERDEIILLGTLRKDGSPRISPVEPELTNGELYLGMIWHSTKARDLQRDPRCTVHCLIPDRFATGGEFKLSGQAREIHDLEERRLFGDAHYARIGYRPEEPMHHLFAIEIESASSFDLTEEKQARLGIIWRAGEPIVRFLHHADDTREMLD